MKELTDEELEEVVIRAKAQAKDEMMDNTDNSLGPDEVDELYRETIINNIIDLTGVTQEAAEDIFSMYG